MCPSMSGPENNARLEPTRIKIARQASSLSKTALATVLGVTPRSINNYECDGAPAAMAVKLANALGCGETFFFMPEIEVLEPERVFFRALRRASASQRYAATAAGRIGVDLYRWVEERYRLPELDVPEFDNAAPATAAEALRACWALGDRPLPNLVQLAESKGIRVLGLPKPAQPVDAFSVWSDGSPYVFLSRAKTPERARFDLAHEIGHLVLHSRTGVVDAGPGVEKEADRFASTLLIPERSLGQGLRRNASVDEILSARTYYGASAMAVNYALSAAGRLSSYGYRQNCIRLAQRGFQSSEPGGMQRHEMSRIFPQVFSHARREHGLTAGCIAQLLGILPSQLHALTLGSAMIGAAGSDGPAMLPVPTAVRDKSRGLRIVQ
jgi:Zn-dependent peptidase ImmA (M78 family)/DNA-binding XRE family transcriptional regulator